MILGERSLGGQTGVLPSSIQILNRESALLGPSCETPVHSWRPSWERPLRERLGVFSEQGFDASGFPFAGEMRRFPIEEGAGWGIRMGPVMPTSEMPTSRSGKILG